MSGARAVGWWVMLGPFCNFPPQVYFTMDSGVREAVLFHKLRLYEEGEQVRWA